MRGNQSSHCLSIRLPPWTAIEQKRKYIDPFQAFQHWREGTCFQGTPCIKQTLVRVPRRPYRLLVSRSQHSLLTTVTFVSILVSRKKFAFYPFSWCDWRILVRAIQTRDRRIWIWINKKHQRATRNTTFDFCLGYHHTVNLKKERKRALIHIFISSSTRLGSMKHFEERKRS